MPSPSPLTSAMLMPPPPSVSTPTPSAAAISTPPAPPNPSSTAPTSPQLNRKGDIYMPYDPFKLYSRRQAEANGELPDVYKYDVLPLAFRVQVCHVIKDTYQTYENYRDSHLIRKLVSNKGCNFRAPVVVLSGFVEQSLQGLLAEVGAGYRPVLGVFNQVSRHEPHIRVLIGEYPDNPCSRRRISLFRRSSMLVEAILRASKAGKL